MTKIKRDLLSEASIVLATNQSNENTIGQLEESIKSQIEMLESTDEYKQIKENTKVAVERISQIHRTIAREISNMTTTDEFRERP